MTATPFDFVTQNHFRRIKDADTQRALFQHSIRMVEVEVCSFCNRKCWFCPNSHIDRSSTRNYMDEGQYLKILRELSEIEYDGMVGYARYGEPLADRIFLDRVRQAREILPKAVLHAQTNGDYVSEAYLKELGDAGLNSLNIQIYVGKNEQDFDGKVLAGIEKMSRAISCELDKVRSEPGEWHEVAGDCGPLRLRIYGRNFSSNGCNRGQLLDTCHEETRVSPCLSPFHHLYFDWNGYAVPCCNIRSDAPEHAGYIVGNIAADSIYTIYADSDLVEWRRKLIRFGPKSEPCADCTFVTYQSSDANRIVTERLYREMDFSNKSLVSRLHRYLRRNR